MQMMNIGQFAFALGQQTRLTLEASLPFHVAYTKADTEGRAALRLEWVVPYIAGRENVTAAKAQKIWAAGKGNEALDAGACNRATRSFDHHVIRSSPKTEGGKPVPKAAVRIPKQARESFEAFVLDLGLSKAQLSELFAQTLKSLE